MNEREWQRARDPEQMLAVVQERLSQRKWVLLLASYVFYGVWSWKFAALMLATTSVDFFTARWLVGATSVRARRGWLALSLVSNLGVLAAFKYFDFFARSVNDASGSE